MFNISALSSINDQYFLNDSYIPTPKGLQFYASGLTARQRLLLGAVRSRKTSLVLKEVSCHLHGIYPKWWNGYRYNRPVRGLVGTVKAEKTRDVLQKYLLEGDPQFGLYPFIHKSLIVDKYSGALRNSVNKLFVKHISGGISELKLSSFSEGASGLQSETFDFAHLDEAPDFDVYQEILYRTTSFGAYKTFVMLTMWPERGMDELVSFFMNKGSAGQSVEDHFYMNCSWADNPTLSEEEKIRLRQATPDYLLDAREHGIPVFGMGKVFQMKESDIIIEDFQIPDHFALIYGLDPAATSGGTYGAVLLAHDRDSDTVFVVKDYKRNNITPVEHHNNLLHLIPDWVPGISDPAGGGEDQHTRESTLDFFRRMGRNLVVANKVKGRKEGVIDDILMRIRSGKFKVFKSCSNYLDEWRRYSRDDKGRIIKQNDHTLDASFYALDGLSKAITKNFLFYEERESAAPSYI